MGKSVDKKIKENKDFSKNYYEIFEQLGKSPSNILHEWEKEGDTIKVFSLFEDSPAPILTQNTFSLLKNNA